MRFIRLILALAVALAVFAPANAQQEERYKITIELTLYGDVPQGETFLYMIDSPGRPGGEQGIPVVLCGGDSGVECRGHGTVYRRSSLVFASVFEIWPRTRVIFTRDPHNYNDRSDWETFYFEEKMVSGDTTFSAWYRFPEAHEQTVPKMPQTGAGGMAHR